MNLTTGSSEVVLVVSVENCKIELNRPEQQIFKQRLKVQTKVTVQVLLCFLYQSHTSEYLTVREGFKMMSKHRDLCIRVIKKSRIFTSEIGQNKDLDWLSIYY